MSTVKELHAALKFGSAKHADLSKFLEARIGLSRARMSERYAALAESEKQYAAYVKASDVEAARKQAKKASGVQDYINIEVPYSYAVAMTIHTYMTSVFMARSPVYQLDGRHGETEMATRGIEALMGYQFSAGGHALPLYCWLFDPLRAGFGVVGQYWDEESVRCRKIVETPQTIGGIAIPGLRPKREYVYEDIPGYHGNRLFNVRPQDFFPDTRVPLWRFQEGEFVGRYVEMPWARLFEGEADGKYFNVKAAKKGGKSQVAADRELGATEVITLPGESSSEYSQQLPSELFKGFELQVKIRPEMLRLGDGMKEEVWVFLISDSGVVVQARPLGMYYSGFAYDIIMLEPDGYNLFPISAMERIKPLNDVLSWLINSHFYNVRSSLNNQFVVDPSRVVMKDVTNRTPGQIIRLKPEALGSDVRAAITQLQVNDVTRSHLNDAQMIELMIQRALGATDNVMGMVNATGRKTATEVRTTTSFGVNRIKTLCEMASASGFSPMVGRMTQSTQQLYDLERKYRIVGDLANFSDKYMNVTPETIVGAFDYVPVDGTMPIDRYAQAQLWQQLMGQAVQVPPIAQSYDFAKIFGWVATLAGLKNIQQFRLQPQGAGQIEQGLQAGNLVPLEAAKADLNRVPDPGRAQNMGATG